MGNLGDRIGRRRLLLIGGAAFAGGGSSPSRMVVGSSFPASSSPKGEDRPVCCEESATLDLPPEVIEAIERYRRLLDEHGPD